MDNKKTRLSPPIYQQIAIEIASRIADGEYKIGKKIYARSGIAAQYNVSPETARRAICVLSDLDIVAAEKGSGVIIKSYKNAMEFIKQYNQRQTVDMIKENIMQSVARQKKEADVLAAHLSELIAATEHFRSVNPFMPFQITITAAMKYLNKTIGELQFWQRTAATLIAIRRGEEIMVSPGPYALLQEHDIIFFITQDDSPQRVRQFLYPDE